jgi:glutaconate CoA-transferase subunit B
VTAADLEVRADLLTVLLAREVSNESVVVMGTSTPLTAVATLLALRHHAPNASYTTPLAGGLSVRPHQISLLDLERAAYDNAAMRGAQIIDLWEMATINPLVADRWLQFFRPAQIDVMGNINNSVIGDYFRPRVRLPGSVGIGDMAAYYPRLYAYVPRHNPPTFPQKVDFVSGVGTVGTEEDRQARGLRWGRPYRVFTDLCVLEFDPDGHMEVASIHPGTTPEQVQAATGFPLRFRNATVTEPASDAELSTLREIDPTGLRNLEFAPARERRALIEAAIRARAIDLEHD